MKKLLFFLLINNLALLSAPIVLPNPTPPAPRLPIVNQTVKPFPQPPMMPAKGPAMITPAPAPITATPPVVQNFPAKPAITVAQTTPAQTTTDLPTIVIHNLSAQPAILTNPIATINSKSTPIAITKPITISKGKQEVHLSIPTSLHAAPSFGGFTSITINGNPISIVHPKTKANYFGNSTIYIDNVNGQWKMVPKPKKVPAVHKPTSPKAGSLKQTLIKPVAKAALNLQAKAKNTKSMAAKTAKSSVVPPMPPAPTTIKTPTTVPDKQ
jgi:hypothetical protein